MGDCPQTLAPVQKERFCRSGTKTFQNRWRKFPGTPCVPGSCNPESGNRGAAAAQLSLLPAPRGDLLAPEPGSAAGGCSDWRARAAAWHSPAPPSQSGPLKLGLQREGRAMPRAGGVSILPCLARSAVIPGGSCPKVSPQGAHSAPNLSKSARAPTQQIQATEPPGRAPTAPRDAHPRLDPAGGGGGGWQPTQPRKDVHLQI